MKFLKRTRTPKVPTGRDAATPRILAYCASNIGLGHYGRLARVLGEIRRRRPEISVLLASDTRETSLVRKHGVAVLSLPGYRFRDHEHFGEEPDGLDMTSHELRDFRSGILLNAGLSFKPNLILMDTNPHGKRDEILPLLKKTAASDRTRTVLMMRSIPCPEGKTFKFNGDEASTRKHASYYDRFIISGEKAFFDAASTWKWPERVRNKLYYSGFVVPRPTGLTRDEALAPWPALNPDHPLIVAGCGGGWNVEKSTISLLDALEAVREGSEYRHLQMLLVTGPAVDAETVRFCRDRADKIGNVAVEIFTTAFPDALSHADLAVLQAGSTPFQILDTSIPMIIQCRSYKDREQHDTASRLDGFEGIRVIESHNISPEAVEDGLRWGLKNRCKPRQTGYRFDGINKTADLVLELL